MAFPLSLNLFLVLASLGFCHGAIHKVGDEKGWTVNDDPNYNAWAKTKIFHVGDVLLFQYDEQFHNLLQVNKAAYHKCNTAAPIAMFNTGCDSIIINSNDYLYFICGTPGHCEAGQKVSIKVTKTKASIKPPLNYQPPSNGQARIAHDGLCYILLSISILISYFV